MLSDFAVESVAAVRPGSVIGLLFKTSPPPPVIYGLGFNCVPLAGGLGLWTPPPPSFLWGSEITRLEFSEQTGGDRLTHPRPSCLLPTRNQPKANNWQPIRCLR